MMIITMASSLDLSELQKKAYADLLDATILALESGELTPDESEKSSRSIVRNLDGLESYTELIFFLRDLSAKFPAYRGIYITYKQNEVAQKDQEKLEEVKEKLHKLTSIAP